MASRFEHPQKNLQDPFPQIKALLDNIERAICAAITWPRLERAAMIRKALQLKGLLIDLLLPWRLRIKAEQRLREVADLLRDEGVRSIILPVLSDLCALLESERDLARLEMYSSVATRSLQSTFSVEEVLGILPKKDGKLAEHHPAMQFLGTIAGLESPGKGGLHILGIIGSGGSGKTTLLFQLMMRAGLGQSEQVIFGEFPSEEPATETALIQVQTSMILQLGGNVYGVHGPHTWRKALKACLMRATADGKPLLIAIDNVWRAQDVKRLLPERIAFLMSASSACCIIAITSRVRSIVEDLQHIISYKGELVPAFTWEQKPLAPAVSKAFLLAHAFHAGHDIAQIAGFLEMGESKSKRKRIATDQQKAAALNVMFQMCDGIPLAIRCLIELVPGIYMEKNPENDAFISGIFEVVLKRSLQKLGESAQRALVDIAMFLHEWRWYEVGNIVGHAELNELQEYCLVECVQGEKSKPNQGRTVRVILRDVLLESIRRKEWKQGVFPSIHRKPRPQPRPSFDEDAQQLLLAGFEQASHDSKLQLWDVRDHQQLWQLGILNWADVQVYLRLDLTCLTVYSLILESIPSMTNLRVLDITGSFHICDSFMFPKSLQYIRFARNDEHISAGVQMPADLLHFELRECNIISLPDSIYECTKLQCLILSDCPRLKSYNSHSWSVWGDTLVELEVEECPGVELELIEFWKMSSKNVRSRLIISDCLRQRLSSGIGFTETQEDADRFAMKVNIMNEAVLSMNPVVQDSSSQLAVLDEAESPKHSRLNDSKKGYVTDAIKQKETGSKESPKSVRSIEMQTRESDCIVDESKQGKVTREECTQPSKSREMLEVSEPPRSPPHTSDVELTVGQTEDDFQVYLEKNSGKQRLQEDTHQPLHLDVQDAPSPLIYPESLLTAVPDIHSPITLEHLQENETEEDEIWHQCGQMRQKPLSDYFKTREQLTLRDCECHDLEGSQLEELHNLANLKLQYCRRLESLPRGIFNLLSLRVLKLQGCSNLEELPMEMGRLTALETLDLHACQKLKRLPKSLTKLTSLVELSLCACAALEALPDNIGKLTGLKTLHLESCESLSRLPDSTSKLVSLVQLDVQGCGKLRELPRRMGYLCNFHAFDFLSCRGTQLELEVLNMDDCCNFRRLPKLRNFKQLRIMSLANCQSLKTLRNSVCDLNSLVFLDLQGCLELKELPRKFGMHLRALELLHLMECQSLRRLPDSICRLEVLTELDMTGCLKLEWLPQHMGSLRALKSLKLAYCESLSNLPDSICKLDSLVVMDMHGCVKLQELPADFGELGKLEVLDLRNCRGLKRFPHIGVSGGLQSLRELDLRNSRLELVVAEKGDLYFLGSDRVKSFFTVWAEWTKDRVVIPSARSEAVLH